MEGVGHAVVLAGLPDDWIPVVLAAVVDSHSDPEGEGGLAVADGLAAVVTGLVGGDAEVGVEPVEGPLGLGLPQGVGVLVAPAAMVELEGLGGRIVVG